MRKFTLFLALMVTMVTSAFAQTVVSNLADFKSDKCYTVTTETRGGWAVKSDGSQFCSTNDAGLGTTSDATDANQQFAVLTVNGEDYFLYSVGAKKFVKSDRSLNANSGDAIEFADAGDNRVRVNFKGINNSFINLGGGNQMTVDWWSTMDAGNKVQFLEVADFDATEALAALNSAVEVVYVYMYNGVEVSREVAKSEIGNAYPALANVPFGFTANTPEGVIAAGGEVIIECTLVENYPIKYAATAEEIDTWYYMQMHSNNKKYIQYLADQAYLEWADAEVAEGEEDSYTWAFVGDPANGFKLVNYAAGKEMAVCSNGSSDPVLGAFADAVVWKPAKSQATGNDGYFCLQFPGGNYMNAQNGKVAYWSSNDAGSTLLLTERDFSTEPVVEALVPTKATRTPAESALSPQNMYQLAGVKLDFAENIKKAEGVTVWGKIVDANDNEVAVLDKIMGGTTWFATPYTSTPVTVAGTYKVIVNAGVFTSADGSKVYQGGEYEFTVQGQPVTIIPAIDEGFFYGETFTTVEEFLALQIRIKGAAEVALTGEAQITMTQGENEYVAELTITEEDGDKLINIAFAADAEYAEGRYTVNVPAGVFTIDGTANEAFVSSSFTYSTPKLKITKDYTSWEQLFTAKYMMPREVAITINNADEVTVAEGLIATLTVGETTYNSTVEFTNEGNNYWISFQFAEIQAIYEDENADFIKGEYTFTVPAGLYTVNGEANVEETRTFTYGDAVVAEFSVKSITPAPGTVLSLDQISLSFTNTTKPEQLIVTNEAGDKFFFISMNGAYVAVDPLANYAEAPITEAGKYTLDLSELEGLVGRNVFTWTVNPNAVMPTEYLSTNEYVPYQLPGIKLVFDEKVTAADLAEGETSYGYILNAAGEKVLELNKKGYISGNLKYVSFTNDNMDYVEGAGDYTVVITATITFESGNIYNGGEFVLTVTKQPAEVTMDVDLWGTLDAMPTTINITVDNVEEIALDETKKATLTIDETVYEAVATLNGNVITLAFPEDVEYANGSYTFVVPEGFFTYDGEPSQEIWESFTYRKAVPLKVLSITPAEGNVESIEKITIVFNQEINANWEFEMNGALFVRTDGWAASATIEYTASVYDPSIWDYAPSPATAPGEYVLNIEYVTEMALAEGEKATYTWTIKEAATESGIDTSKEYYLYSSYNWGMNKGYLAIGTKSGSNYGPAYMANEKLQAFKLTPAADGGYTLSREADMGGMKYTEYIDCTHAYNVGNNAMSGSVLHFELNTNNKYYIKSDNGYFKADMINYGTDGYAYHVFSDGDMTSALEWELIPVEDVVEPEQPAVEPLNYVSHTPATAVESISEVTITFDREVGSVSSDLSNVKLKLGTSVPARGMSSAINGNSVTIYLGANVKKSGEYTLEIPADIIKAADGGVFAGTTLTIIVDAAPAMTSSANVNVDNTLSTITAEFDSEVEFAAESDVTVLNVYVQNTETVAATITVANNASIEGNVLTLTLDEAIAPEVTTKYTVEIPAGWIIKKGSDKAFAGKKLTYTVKIPFALKNITPASGSTVEVFENIVAEYNATVNFYPSATNFKLINVADNSEIALVATKDGNVVTFTTDAEVPNGTYKLANLNNVVDNSSFLAPAELPEYTITVDNTTAIEGVDAEAEQTIYDLTGRRITEITKGGIYIVNGKKVLVK